MKITAVTCHVLAGPDLDVSAALPIPIAAGEWLTTRFEPPTAWRQRR